MKLGLWKSKGSFIFISDKLQKSNSIVKFYYQDHVLPFGHLSMRAVGAIEIFKGLWQKCGMGRKQKSLFSIKATVIDEVLVGHLIQLILKH